MVHLHSWIWWHCNHAWTEAFWCCLLKGGSFIWRYQCIPGKVAGILAWSWFIHMSKKLTFICLESQSLLQFLDLHTYGTSTLKHHHHDNEQARLYLTTWTGCKFNHEQWIASWSCVDLQGDSEHDLESGIAGESTAYKFPIQSIDLVISWISLYIVPSPYAVYCRLPGYLIIQLSIKGNPTMYDDISIRRHAYYYHTHHHHHASLTSSSTTHCLHHWCIK